MTKKLWILMLLSMLLISSLAVVPVQAASGGQPCGDITTVRLLAGQTIDAGTVSVWNDATNLYVKFSTSGSWYLAETHVAVALSLSGIPQQNGNPIPGRFPYKTIHNPVVTEYTYAIPLSSYTAGTRLVVAAHASLVKMEGGQIVQQETGWGEGPAFTGRNWATYFYFTVQACQEEPGAGCTLTQGYWKTHSKYGPAKYDATWAKVGEDSPFFINGGTWYQAISTPSRGGDAYYILSRQYVAAVLNRYNGASVPADVAAAMTQAANWLSTHRSPIRSSTADGRMAIRLATLLDQYNNGVIGPGHCGDGAPLPTVTPPPSLRTK